MRPGTVIADRYTIFRLARSGGMGSVYEARDRLTGDIVAIKVLRGDDPELIKRFQREARVLGDLAHPNIVRYLSHGVAASGTPYLTMEWLVGEDLAQRLKRGALSLAETLAIARMACEALATAHRHGIIHRDVKPHNLFLVAPPGHDAVTQSGAAPASQDFGTVVKLVDFGVAHFDASALTRSGQAVGTPGYMAPEQARGAPEIDARSDIFSLGCVIFACLTGHSPFAGDNAQAVLAKVLFEEPARLRDEVSVPAELDELVASMLAKDPARRPADAGAILSALGEGPSQRARHSGPHPAVGASEQQFTCVLVAGPPAQPRAAAPARLEELGAIADAHGARLETLADGTLVAVFRASAYPSDVATRAAHCALAIRPLVDAVPLVIATGRAVVTRGALPVGAVIDRATALLPGARADVVLLDKVTAGLLELRFHVRRDAQGFALAGERAVTGGSRRLLGKTTAIVGRDRELLALQTLFNECRDEPRARVVLLTGPAGSGKSRLRQEHLGRLAESSVPVDVWIGRGDPMRGGAPLAILADALRAPMGISGGEPAAQRRAKIHARVARHFDGADLARVCEFLGEVCATPFPDDDSVQLRAARHDAVLMGDQVRRAFEDWLGAEVGVQPVVIVLEDLHWGDWPSIKMMDAALRHLADRPLFVLALARPDIHEIFSGLWAERSLEEIKLRELPRSAGEELVRQVLGPLPPEVVVPLVARSQGNPFYLEELIRMVVEDPEAEFPESVVAMVQARLGRLDPAARKVLRAASVFGQVCWDGGVAALVGDEAESRQLLGELAAREWLEQRRESRFAGQRELAFGHTLLREAAYATFTDDDRALGHRLAAAWLETAGETNPVTLAEHHQRGGDHEKAITGWVRAAEQALDGSDFAAALAHAARAASLGARGAALGALRLVQAEAHSWRAEHAAAEPRATEALALLPRDSDLWATAVHHAAWALRVLGKQDALAALAEDLCAGYAARQNRRMVIALCAVAANLLAAGLYPLAGRLQRLVEAVPAEWADDPLVRAWIADLRVWAAAIAGNPAEMRQHLRDSIASWDATGDRRNACNARTNMGYACIELGAYEEAERELRAAMEAARRMSIQPTVDAVGQNLGWLLALDNRLEDAARLLDETIGSIHERGDPRNEGVSRLYRARVHLLAGERDPAAAECEVALRLLEAIPSWRAYALAVKAAILLAGDAVAAAAEPAGQSQALVGALDALEEGEAFARCVCAEAAWRAGDHDQARAAIAVACDRVRTRADRIRDPALRGSFLERVADHARCFQRAEEWIA